MKHFVLLAVLFIFSAGAIAPAVFAFECPMMNKMAMNQIAVENMAMDSDMPCHDPQDEPNECDGLCLCLHLSVNNAKIYQDSFVVFAPIATQDVFAPYDGLVHSAALSPLFKPPITLS